MCVDFTDLNTSCSNDSYLLPNIKELIYGSSGYNILSFMSAYSGYYQIKMDPFEAPKTTFMSNHDNYYYNIIPFGQKNACHMMTSYQFTSFSKKIIKF